MFPACIIRFSLIFLTFLALLAQSRPILQPKVETERRVYAVRQQDAAFDGPKTFQSINTTSTAGGIIVQTCKVTLTPVVVDGQNLVVETKECTSVLMPEGSLNTATATDTASTVTVTSGTSTVVVTATVTDSSAESTATSSDSSNTETSSASEASATASATASGIEVIGFSSSVAAEASSSAASEVASETASSVSVIATLPAGGLPEVIGFTSGTASATASASDVTSVAASATATATAASGPQVIGFSGSSSIDPSATAAQATESAQAIQLPGTQLSVLPIGLGVVGGVVGVVLIVVAIVTWERKNYRFDFRKRKQQGLASSGAPVGYGGMAQR